MNVNTTSTEAAATKPAADKSAQPPPQKEIADSELATALISITGPCRALGDLYLSCVATAGLGMCRTLRYDFTQCANAAVPQSQAALAVLGDEWCGDMGESATTEEKMDCAAKKINQQLVKALRQSATRE